MTKNAYIHIPFCKSKCNYCSFVSYPKLELKEKYIDALIREIKEEYNNENLETLYFGGGTPSNLGINDFKKILSLFNFTNGAEITTEINPDGITEEYLKDLKSLGINRISIGTQSFDDEILKLIGRRHKGAQAKLALLYAKNAGFQNISLDFIYGLPTQDIKGFENDLKKAVELSVQHISLYGLKIDEGCNFYQNPPKSLPDLDEQADMYLKAIEILEAKGFEHYEISNFSLPKFNSKHNLNYWDNNSYYGFGCAASGYVNEIRYTNETNVEEYIKNPLKKISEHKLSKQEILEEAIFLGFRKMTGININEINQRFEIDFNKKYAKILTKYTNYFTKTANGYTLTTEGLLISNSILSEFID